jgi:uncharacterized protein
MQLIDNQFFEENNNRPSRPLADLAVFLLMLLTGALIGNILIFGIASAFQLDVKSILELDENAPLGMRNIVRLVVMLNNTFTFMLPALVFGFWKYRSAWSSFFTFKNLPRINHLFLGAVILLAAIPFVQYVFLLNKMIPLPDWMKSVEDDTEKLIKGLLKVESPYETLINIVVISIIPAIGEELVFRGVLQQKLYQLFAKNPHIAIWVAAAVFSAIHVQFEGFFPRMILGAVLGYLFYFTKSLWVAIFAHFANNFVQIIAFQAQESGTIQTDLEKMEMPWYAGLLSLGIVVGLLFLLKRDSKENL